MNNSSSSSSVSTSSLKPTRNDNKNKDTGDSLITINEKINLTKQQYQNVMVAIVQSK
jgi:hypothetical protein